MSKGMDEIRKEDYLSFIQETSHLLEQTYDERTAAWKRQINPDHVWGFMPPAFPLEAAVIDAFLYSITGEEAYALRAADRLASYRDFSRYFSVDKIKERPEYAEGLPPVPSFFHLFPCMVAYDELRGCAAISQERRREIEAVLTESVPSPITRIVWGAHNGCASWAATYAAAVRFFPDHPEAGQWRQAQEVFVDDHWGKWTIEDTQIYHGLWLHALIYFADLTGRPEFFRQVTTQYYLRYFVRLLSPTGMLPEFGDARFNDEWPPYVACLERGASVYRDPEMKYAARKIFSGMAPLSSPSRTMIALHLLDAYRWADDTVEPTPPTSGSEEVLEDLVGKKLVFRSGWDDEATYLMLNYRDEFGFGRTPRTYLKTTLMVRAEKTQHGHADENAICLMTSGGGVLLHDSGYVEEIGSGAYRADFYHNRLIGRSGMPAASQPVIDFLKNSGAYKRLRTEKIHFYRFEAMDVGRTRVYDPEVGYEWDRCLFYVKDPERFVIVDGVRVTRVAGLTFSNLFYTQKVLARGPGWYDTMYETIPTDEMTPIWGERVWNVSGSKTLLVRFLDEDGKRDGVEELRRSYQTERCIHQTTHGDFSCGQFIVFATVLIPHDSGASPEDLAATVELVKPSLYPEAVGIRIAHGETTMLIGSKLNLDYGLLDEHIRPRFDFESSKVDYGDLTTDAVFCMVEQREKELSYAAAEMTKVVFAGKTLFSGTPISNLCPDRSLRPGVIRQRQWEGQERI